MDDLISRVERTSAKEAIEILKANYPDACFEQLRDAVDAAIHALKRPEYYDYSDIDDIWEYYAEEQDIKLTDGAKQLKDAMWVGYRKGKQDAQPERKTGKWITKSTNGEMFDCCSACGYVEWDVPKNFCPNCGADMRGEQDE